MVAAIWKDVSSYSKDGPRIPTAWQISLPEGFRICVVQNHRDYPGKWVLHCEPFFNTHLLKEVSSAEEAQHLALFKVKSLMKRMCAFLEGLE